MIAYLSYLLVWSKVHLYNRFFCYLLKHDDANEREREKKMPVLLKTKKNDGARLNHSPI